MSSARYAIVLPHKLSGRAEKRLLNRARACPFCGKPLDATRRLFTAITDFWHRDLVAAHPPCAEQENKRINAGQEEARRRMTPACQLFTMDLIAAVIAAEDEMILHGRTGFADGQQRPATPAQWQPERGRLYEADELLPYPMRRPVPPDGYGPAPDPQAYWPQLSPGYSGQPGDC